MSSNLKVTVKMDGSTLEKLQKRNYLLFAFRAVETNAEGGMPVVWFSTTGYSELTDVSWQETYGAFASQTEVKSGTQIAASCFKEINLNQKMEVVAPLQCKDPVSGIAGCIAVLNSRDSELPSCGISEKNQAGEFAPLCAFPLFGGNMIMLKPIQKVFLMFANKPIVTKTVIAQSVGPGLLIDLTNKQERTISYDVNKNWIWDPKEGYAEAYAAGSDLAPRLIIPSEGLKMASMNLLI
ncbi:Uncharacterised protein [uncultured archaeon]|nr:Uncharacterised protein [uncultured archaeon]